jgi:hypothetical protein
VKTILLLTLLVGCVDEPTETSEPCDESTPVVYPLQTYCVATLDEIKSSEGFVPGPCSLTMTVDMKCNEHDVEHQAYNQMVLYWEAKQPALAFDFLALTYTCNVSRTVTFYGTVCSGSPMTVVAGFQQPVTGEYATDQGNHLCADARVVP